MDELQKLAEEVRKLQPGTPERDAYLEKLRQMVEAGEYRVDANELARKLLNEVTGHHDS